MALTEQEILKKHFSRADGFADTSVTVLDPAAGTLTFIAEATKLAVNEFISKYGSGGRENFIREHILKNLYAFELMMAPYAVGHLKMAFLLEELGYKMKEDDRVKLYLTNTLEMEELAETKLPGMSSLSEESHLAGEVKKKTPILVILGNPPYSGHSANMKPAMVKFIKDNIDGLQSYYKVDGESLKEKNPKWLQDDYVKFIRFAQWKIQQAGEGVLGFITNHSYLDNPTFRGMRQSLMKTFNEIYILDLHGNSLKKEKSPDGSKDENVFDIQQGVAIAFFIKKRDTRDCKVYHSEKWGLRENKYEWLRENTINMTAWRELYPKSEFYLFIPREESLSEIYEKFKKITDIFPKNSVGIVTSRDNFVIDMSRESLLNRIRVFKNSSLPNDQLHEAFQISKKKGWSIRHAWNSLQSITDLELNRFIKPILYRPFDCRWIFYHDALIERSRKEVMWHIMKENLGLLTCRQQNKVGFFHSFVSEYIVESCVVSNKTREINYLFPLYFYSEKNSLTFLKKKTPNIDSKLLNLFVNTYQKEPSPENIFFYIYAILYSNIYRTKYAEFLKIDFPRIPFTKDYEVFKKMAELGQKLVSLHLLSSEELDQPVAKFEGEGDNKVEKVRYEAGKIFINATQYFG